MHIRTHDSATQSLAFHSFSQPIYLAHGSCSSQQLCKAHQHALVGLVCHIGYRHLLHMRVLNTRRPLTAAVAAAGRGTFTLDGVPRMRERPIQDLVDGLVQLGVSASCTMGTGCPPVTVEAQGLPSGTVCAS